MSRPKLEVADVFRRFGAGWRAANEAHINLAQRRVMTAIEICRTAALGGHVERCEDCAHTRVAYNSCLMGKSSNGELAWRCCYFPANCSPPRLHNIAALRPRRLGHRWPVTNGD